MKGFLALALSAVVSAAPAAPAKFALQFNVNFEGKPTTLFYGKALDASGTPDIKSAASCSIVSGDLRCEGKSIGVSAQLGRGALDMGALVATDTKANPEGIASGFTVDDAGALHWKNDEFKKIGGAKLLYKNQGGEARWGFFKSDTIGNGNIQLYAQLGCPMGTHDGLHEPLTVGTAKVVAL